MRILIDLMSCMSPGFLLVLAPINYSQEDNITWEPSIMCSPDFPTALAPINYSWEDDIVRATTLYQPFYITGTGHQGG